MDQKGQYLSGRQKNVRALPAYRCACVACVCSGGVTRELCVINHRFIAFTVKVFLKNG